MTSSTKRMRIVHWCQNFLGGGGVANAVLGLANAQSQLGHTVLITAVETEGPALYEPLTQLVQCEVLTWKPRIRLRSGGVDLAVPKRKFIEQLNRLRPDIVHIHGEFLPSNIWVGRAATCPTVLTPHGAFHPRLLDSKGWKRRLRRNLYIHFATAFFYRRLQAVHALSPAEERHVHEIMPNMNVYCIPQGPSAQMELHLNQKTGENGGRASGAIKLLFVGRLDIHTKGLDILLKAFAQATRRLAPQNIRLTLVGPDWRGSLPFLQKIVGELGIREKVEFVGPKHGTALAQLLCQADLFVLLSRHEGFPLSLTEALIAGKPSIVSTEVGSLSYPEVASLRYIYPVKPDVELAAEAITFCLSNISALRNSAAEFAPQARKFFQWSTIASLHVERYRDFLERGDGSDRTRLKIDSAN